MDVVSAAHSKHVGFHQKVIFSFNQSRYLMAGMYREMPFDPTSNDEEAIFIDFSQRWIRDGITFVSLKGSCFERRN